MSAYYQVPPLWERTDDHCACGRRLLVDERGMCRDCREAAADDERAKRRDDQLTGDRP